MTDVYMEQNGSKKKLLVPLIVLLLCAVSLTGAGYAYNSTVTNEEDNIHIEGLTLELTTGTTDRVHVKEALFNLKVAYNSHITMGKAINGETDKGFVTDNNVKSVKTVTNYSNLAEFDDGFYVETNLGGNPVGYCTTPSEINAESLENAAADSANTGVYAIGGPYNLTVINATGSDVGVSIKATFDNAGASFGDGVKGIYVTITGTIAAGDNGSEAKTVTKAVDITDIDATGKMSQLIDTFKGDQSAPTDLIVKTYVVCSDYSSEDKPAVDNVDYGFRLTFVAATPEQ